MDIQAPGRTLSVDGLAGTGYDDTDASGTVASGTDGLDGTVGGTATASASAGLSCSRSHGNTVPPVPVLAASSSSPGPHSCIPGNGKANNEGRHIHRKRM